MKIIQKIKKETKKVNALAFLALMLIAGMATASSAKGQANVTWGQLSDGTWTKANASHQCSGLEDVCTRDYPEGQDPNENPAGFTNEIEGEFSQNP